MSKSYEVKDFYEFYHVILDSMPILLKKTKKKKQSSEGYNPKGRTTTQEKIKEVEKELTSKDLDSLKFDGTEIIEKKGSIIDTKDEEYVEEEKEGICSLCEERLSDTLLDCQVSKLVL